MSRLASSSILQSGLSRATLNYHYVYRRNPHDFFYRNQNSSASVYRHCLLYHLHCSSFSLRKWIATAERQSAVAAKFTLAKCLRFLGSFCIEDVWKMITVSALHLNTDIPIENKDTNAFFEDGGLSKVYTYTTTKFHSLLNKQQIGHIRAHSVH